MNMKMTGTKQRYAIAYRALGGDVRCMYAATAQGAVKRAERLVGVQPLAITHVPSGRNIPCAACGDGQSL